MTVDMSFQEVVNMLVIELTENPRSEHNGLEVLVFAQLCAVNNIVVQKHLDFC